MDAIIRLQDAFGYFRMGLVTGLVDKPALVAWNHPEHDLHHGRSGARRVQWMKRAGTCRS